MTGAQLIDVRPTVVSDADPAAGPLAGNASSGTAAPAGGRPRLSVIVLTYNEAHRLRPCLESVAFADEVIVVDSFSTDDTCAVAREHTAHVYQSDLLGPKNPGGFSEQRNFALTKATGDWVLFLDADERITPALREDIVRRLLSPTPSDRHDAYAILRTEYYFGVRAEHVLGQSWHVRLIRRGHGRFTDRRVHESLSHDGSLGRLCGDMLHYSKDSVAHHVDTINRYTSLEAEELLRQQRRLPRSPWRLMARAFAEKYLYNRGYREGTFGLLMSLSSAFYLFLTWAKQWELEKAAGRIPAQAAASIPTRLLAGGLANLWHFVNVVRRRDRQGLGERDPATLLPPK